MNVWHKLTQETVSSESIYNVRNIVKRGCDGAPHMLNTHERPRYSTIAPPHKSGETVIALKLVRPLLFCGNVFFLLFVSYHFVFLRIIITPECEMLFFFSGNHVGTRQTRSETTDDMTEYDK